MTGLATTHSTSVLKGLKCDGTDFYTRKIILTTEGRKNWKVKKPKRRNNAFNSTLYFLPILQLTDLFMLGLSALPHSIQDTSAKTFPSLYSKFLSPLSYCQPDLVKLNPRDSQLPTYLSHNTSEVGHTRNQQFLKTNKWMENIPTPKPP